MTGRHAEPRRLSVPRASAQHFLRALTRAARTDRVRFTPPPFWLRQGKDFAEIWIPSAGCAWDLSGHCFACNFGHPFRPSHDQMVEGVALGLAALDTMPAVLWVSSFNFLDPREVHPSVRRRILALIARTGCQVVFTESHPRTITPEAIADCVAALPGKRFMVEIGVESTSDFVRTWGFGKDFDGEELRRAVACVREGGAACCFNIMVGMPMLSEIEAIRDATASVHESFMLGADSVVLFPCRVKENTLLGSFHAAGHAPPITLTSLAAVIAGIDPALWPRIHLSWFTQKRHPGHPASLDPPILHGTPAMLMDALTRFDECHDGTALIALARDASYQEWLANSLPQTPLPDRMLAAFASAAGTLLNPGWWDNQRSAVECALRADWKSACATRLS